MHIFCIVNVFYPLNRGLDTHLCIVSVFYLLNGGLDIRGRELLLGYSPVSTSVNSIKKMIIMSMITMIMMRQ